MWRVGVIKLVLLACILRATTEKGRKLFRGKKCITRENPGYTYDSYDTSVVHTCTKTLSWFTLSIITNKIHNCISICIVYLYLSYFNMCCIII